VNLPSIAALIRNVLATSHTPLSARQIAMALPMCNADSVAAQVSIMARAREIVRHHDADGILRYKMPASPTAASQPARIARTYKPPVESSPVRVTEGEALAAPPAPRGSANPTASDDGTIPLQQMVRLVVESNPDRRWSLHDVVSEVGKRIGAAHARPDQVRARLHNLCRSGHSSPLRRMPADGAWMVNTPQAREAARIEDAARAAEVKTAATRRAEQAAAKAAQRKADQELAAAARAEKATAKAAKPPTKPLQIPQARQGAAEDAIERADEARAALRTLIASVVTHIPSPPPQVILAMQRGLCLFASEAR
jgi:hypothetical protein